VPLSVERYSQEGKRAMKLLHDLGDKAPVPGGVAWASFVAGTLRELSIGLIPGIISCIVLALERLPG
jgi:hypothetical protein